MTTYLLKTEPSVYSYADLARERETVWNGVANPAALANIRAMRPGDEALIYHTGDERAVVGLAKVIGKPIEDPEQLGLTKDGQPKFAVVKLAAAAAGKEPVTLATMKQDERFAGFDLLRLPRLSVMPVPPAMDRLIRKLGGLPA